MEFGTATNVDSVPPSYGIGVARDRVYLEAFRGMGQQVVDSGAYVHVESAADS
jgi:hypothetical protein